jgi:hypothetical protein
MAIDNVTVTRSLTVAELNEMYWIRVRGVDLGLETSLAIRHACLRGLERGIADIVIELTGVEHVCAEGIDTIEAAADELGAKHGTLSLAVRHDESVGRIDLRHVPATGLAELAGLSVALDEALRECGRLHPSPPTTNGGDPDAR